MTRQDILKKVRIAIGELLYEDCEYEEDARFMADLNFDSLDVYDFVMKLENVFDIKIPDEAFDRYKDLTIKECVDYLEAHIAMSKEEYRNKLEILYNTIGKLSAERDRLIVERMHLIQYELEALGLKLGMNVPVIDHDDQDVQRAKTCTFNGVRCGRQHEIYLEFTYPMNTIETIDAVVSGHTFSFPHVVDVNHDLTIVLPTGAIDYRQFMNKYV